MLRFVLVVVVVVVVVVYILFWLMHLLFFIHVHLHRYIIEMGSPNLSTESCNTAPLPFPNNTNSFYTQLVYLCALFMSNSCTPFETWVIN